MNDREGVAGFYVSENDVAAATLQPRLSKLFLRLHFGNFETSGPFDDAPISMCSYSLPRHSQCSYSICTTPLWLSFFMVSVLIESGATIGMSHLRHKRAEDLRPECVAILSHHIPLSRSIHQNARTYSLAFESTRSRISKCAGLNKLIASHHQHHQKLRHTKQLDPSHHSQHYQKDYYIS